MTRPNVLLITTHDTGRYLGCYGESTVVSPNLDALAASGVRFTRYFATSSLCSPSRGAIMTGLYPQTNGMLGLCHPPMNWRMHDGVRHLSHLLHDAGYFTILLGHQHETWQDEDHQMCFDERALYRAQTGRHTFAKEVADGAREFLASRAAAKAPFFLQLGLFETHHPFDHGGAEPDTQRGVNVPPFLVDNEAAREQLAAFQGSIRNMDHHVGRVLDALRRAGLERDTLVIYTVDHGIPFPRAKASLHDRGLETALLMRWPGGGIDGGAVRDALLSNVDLTPTVLDLVGVESDVSFDGTSFAEIVRAGGPGRQRVFAMLQGHTGNMECRSVRTDRHRLIRYFAPKRLLKVPVDAGTRAEDGPRPTVELFDLQVDPEELTDLAGDPAQAKTRAALDAALWAWLEAVDDPILQGPIRTPFYERTMAERPG